MSKSALLREAVKDGEQSQVGAEYERERQQNLSGEVGSDRDGLGFSIGLHESPPLKAYRSPAFGA